MTKKMSVYSFIFALILTLFSFKSVSVKAYTESKIVPQPDVMCDLELGCLLYTHFGEEVDYNTKFYDRTDPNTSWYDTIMTGSCGITIGAAGCAVAAQATIGFEFIVSTPSIDPDVINISVTTSCSYSGTEFHTAYPEDIGFTYSLDHKSLSGKSKQTIINLLGPLVASGKLIIMQSNRKITASNGNVTYESHFELIDGFKADVKHFQFGITATNFTELYMNDSSNRDSTLTQFLIRYPYPVSSDSFTDLR